jgi:hypothetical protein
MSNLPPSRAAALFERITTDANPSELIRSFIASKFSESELLDYKGADKLDIRGDPLREKWSKSLSCFANSDGGVLIWGVDAPNNIPQKVSLVGNVHELKAKLLELQSRATEPPVQFVKIEAFADGPGTDAGFVVCLIPPSPWKPHQAKWPRLDYFIRTGDNCLPATHSLLKALFQPQNASVIEVFARPFINMGIYKTVNLQCWLRNAGPSSAYDVFVLYKYPEGIMIPKTSDVWNPTASGYTGTAVIAKRPLHPTEMVSLLSAQLGHFNGDQRILAHNEFEFEFRIFCQHQVPVVYRLTVRAEDIDRGVQMKAFLQE